MGFNTGQTKHWFQIKPVVYVVKLQLATCRPKWNRECFEKRN